MPSWEARSLLACRLTPCDTCSGPARARASCARSWPGIGLSHHDVYEDAVTIAFLVRQPTLLGYCVVAPKRHVEDWVGGLGEEEYLALQRVVRRVAEAVAKVVPVERMYSLSLGSRQGNAHLHWHVAPLPPGVPYERQQYYALMAENGVLDVDDSSQEDLARAIRSRL